MDNKINQIKRSKVNLNKLFLVFISILLFVLLYILIKYYATTCYSKKELKDYLIDFTFEPCLEKYKPASLKERVYLDEDEVFHIGNQTYTYEQAKCKCKSYNAELATKNQLINSYNKGADWCSYGWSANQEAYYPTQKCTFDKLQRGPMNQRFKCGYPGVNGGRFNKNIRFGVNCYGIKPAGSVVKEKEPHCKTDFCSRKNNYKASHKLENDHIQSFNQDKWSKYN